MNNKLKIVQINTHDIIGGAEKTSLDLHIAYRDNTTIESSLIVGGMLGDILGVSPVCYLENKYERTKFWKDNHGFTEIGLTTPLKMCCSSPEIKNADIVHIHNIHGQYWNLLSLPILAWQKPVVLTLHDEFMVTGDCCYTYDCSRWKNSCGKCPQIKLAKLDRYALGGQDKTRFNVLLKRLLLRMPNRFPIAAVAPSKWLSGILNESRNFKNIICQQIYNGVDLEKWSPGNQANSRKKLGLGEDKTIGLIVASNLADRRKGFDISLEAIKQLPKNCNMEFLLIGNISDELRDQISGLPITSVGFVSDHSHKQELFSAANFTFSMSRVDNLPYMCVESLACGRPVYGSRLGGIPEIIRNTSCGWLESMPHETNRIAERLVSIANTSPSEWEHMYESCRKTAEDRFSLDQMVNSYQQLYRDLCSVTL